jgi:hypothetical protein
MRHFTARSTDVNWEDVMMGKLKTFFGLCVSRRVRRQFASVRDIKTQMSGTPPPDPPSSSSKSIGICAERIFWGERPKASDPRD